MVYLATYILPVQVCRHHAAAVATGCGSAQQFECPYHGWTYGEPPETQIHEHPAIKTYEWLLLLIWAGFASKMPSRSLVISPLS